MPITVRARRVLLATGVSDILPALPGFRELWGGACCTARTVTVGRCEPFAVYDQGRTVTGLALLVSRWSPDVIVVTDGPGYLTPNARRRLRHQKIGIREEPVMRLIGSPTGGLRCIEFADGSQLERVALFLYTPQHQRSPLAAELGARLTSTGAVWVDKNAQTSVAGIYAVGDTTPGTQQALLAAAAGNQVAICLNENLTREEFPR